MIKCMIFDFDGLILDTEVVWYHAYDRWLRENYAYEMTMEEFVLAIGSTNDAFLAVVSKNIGRKIDSARFNYEVDIIAHALSQNLTLMPGVVELLDYADNHSIKCAIATSSKMSHIIPHLKRLGIRERFEAVSTADHVSKIKPSPDVYLKVLSDLDVRPENAIVFEDSLNGMLAATRANLNVIVVENQITKHIDFPLLYRAKCSNLHEALHYIAKNKKKDL